MKTVLSTKILTPSQKELFLNSGLGLVEYDALKIEFLDTKIPLDHQNYIFTSRNAVHAFLQQTKGLDRSPFRCFCVGEKTKSLLEYNGVQVTQMIEYASDLGQFIVENHPNEAFVFVCGQQRRDDLPHIFSKNNIRYKEVVVYSSILNPKTFQKDFDGILFFSPRGIQSFLLENSPKNSTLFCIGETTATEARKHSKHIIIANKPTVENVLVQAIKHFKAHD